MKTFIVQASLTIVTYDRKNIFLVQATDVRLFIGLLGKFTNWYTVFKSRKGRPVRIIINGLEVQVSHSQHFIFFHNLQMGANMLECCPRQAFPV
jgi:hypothetical protein